MSQIQDLNKTLFDRLEVLNNQDLSEEELNKEIMKTDAIVKVSDAILKNATLALKAQELFDAYGTDMLGYIYMHLEIGSKKAGQFFTPYHLCRLMAKMQSFTDEVVKVNEPTCGAGGNIIALAEAMKEKGINYQQNLIAVCQDIDVKAVYMAYVQLTLYGIPGVVFQSDTLQDPNGQQSGTGRMYTFGYMMAPKLWKEA